MTRKKVIVTGCDGFIGYSLINYLKKNTNYEIIGIDRKNDNNITNIKFYHQDINDGLPDIKDVYAVVHLAAKPGVRDSHENFENVCKDNILATQRVIKKCIDSWKPKKILIASSSSVYGLTGDDCHDLHEYEWVNPVSPYGASKVMDELLLTTYHNCGLLKGVVSISMRFFTVYGPKQRDELSIRSFIDHILRDEPIIVHGDGSQVRDFTNISDICSAICLILDKNDLIQGHSTFNIGSGEQHSLNEIIHMLSTLLDKDVTIHYTSKNIWDVFSTKADNSKIKDLGWKPRVKFIDGIKEQIKWQKEEYEKEK